MYNLAPANAPWFEHLTDSVRALGEAAREWQLAATAATLAHAHADVQRHPWHQGKVTGQPSPEVRGWAGKPAERSPHMNAVFDLQRLYLNVKHDTARGYEHAALLFASGAAWAVRRVRAGHHPERVVFATDDTDRRSLVPGTFNADLDALKEARLSTAGKLQKAHTRLQECLWARDVGEDIGSQDYVSDHEASDMHECWTLAEGIADAAYAYTLLVEQALGFVLLGPKEAHRKQLAAEKQAAAADEDGDGPGPDDQPDGEE